MSHVEPPLWALAAAEAEPDTSLMHAASLAARRLMADWYGDADVIVKGRTAAVIVDRGYAAHTAVLLAQLIRDANRALALVEPAGVPVPAPAPGQGSYPAALLVWGERPPEAVPDLGPKQLGDVLLSLAGWAAEAVGRYTGPRRAAQLMDKQPERINR